MRRVSVATTTHPAIQGTSVKAPSSWPTSSSSSSSSPVVVRSRTHSTTRSSTAATFLLSSVLYGYGLTIERGVVQVLDRCLGVLLVFHVNESAPVDDVTFDDIPVALKESAQFLWTGPVSQAPHEYLCLQEGVKMCYLHSFKGYLVTVQAFSEAHSAQDSG